MATDVPKNGSNGDSLPKAEFLSGDCDDFSDDPDSAGVPDEQLSEPTSIDGVSGEQLTADIDDVSCFTQKLVNELSDCDGDPCDDVSVETPEQKRQRYNDASALRFGELFEYVDQKLEDPESYAIRANLKIGEYIHIFLEFLAKKHLIYNFLTSEERAFIFSDENNPYDPEHPGDDKRRIWNSVARYFKSPCIYIDSLSDCGSHHTIESAGLEGEELASSELFRQREEIEQRLADIKRKIVREHASFFRRIPELKLFESGPAIGALTTMIALRVIDLYYGRFGLLSKVRVTQNDVSPKVLARNGRGDFDIGDQAFVGETFGSRDRYHMLKLQLVHGFQSVQGPIEMGLSCLSDRAFDIVLACDLFHHVSRDSQPDAAKELARLTRGACFVGDETPRAHDLFAAKHQDDLIKPAPEDPITAVESRALFGPGMTSRSRTLDDPNALWYAYWFLGNPDADSYGHYFNLLPREEEAEGGSGGGGQLY